MSNAKGVLLVNLGTPDSPEPDAVGRYLREFLMDPLVIDIPAPFRLILVNFMIVPKRKVASSELYRNIWTSRGSPLLFHSQDLGAALQKQGFAVEVAMRYGNPSISEGLGKLKARGITGTVTVVPQYPQYAESSYLSTQLKTLIEAAKHQLDVRFVPAFYNDDGYLDVSAELTKEFLIEWPADHLLMSYHGLPVHHLHKTDRSRNKDCLKTSNCCEKLGEGNRLCYRAHCIHTSREIALRAKLKPGSWSLSFQSRLGRREWIGPDTEKVLVSLAEGGVKRLAVACPSFTADCLETLEEIGFRAKETFLRAGGKELRLIPALNADPRWVTALASLVRSNLE